MLFSVLNLDSRLTYIKQMDSITYKHYKLHHLKHSEKKYSRQVFRDWVNSGNPGFSNFAWYMLLLIACLQRVKPEGI